MPVITVFEPGTIWRLKSGRLVEIGSIHKGANRANCFYVDDLGRPMMPRHRNEVTLDVHFLDSYARRVRLDGLDNRG